ncbi:hypothetical protein [Brevundimonas sp.]|uniref:hypothetical protein n=1 Tax=Brevundimonas sp. TaxID=1871086 RepID=UPI002D5672CE|nr:hypothetical protein [Brevundimonas sp.]HYC99433.1 hypothetical protein [Brevundimonas sp.]
MRRTVLALLAAAALVAGCQRPAEAPAAEPAPADAAPPEMPADAPPQEEVDPAMAASPAGQPGSCLSEIGATASARLVERCIAVSPATRPPCNAANPCEMIQGEIDRACEMYAPGEAKPAECGA